MRKLNIFLPLLLLGTILVECSERTLSPQEKARIERDSLIKVGTAFKVNSHRPNY